MHTKIRLWPLVFFFQQCFIFTLSIGVKSDFLVRQNKRINGTAYEETVTESVVFCARICQSDESCTAANFEQESKTCHLFNKTCFLDEDVPGWSYLSRPLPAKRTFQYIPLQLTWDNAESYCESIGGGLANVMTTTDYVEILNIVNQIESTTTHIWLGGTDNDIEGEWVWSNGCRFDDQGFDFWKPTEPNNANNNEHCLILLTRDLQWHDLVCERAKHFVCEVIVSFN